MPTNDCAAEEQFMAHAWAWFCLHSDQRMKLTNFWLVAMAFLVAAYAQALASDRSQQKKIRLFRSSSTVCGLCRWVFYSMTPRRQFYAARW